MHLTVVGGFKVAASTSSIVHTSDDQWMQATSWDLKDSQEFALDADNVYDAALSTNIMDEPVIKKPEKKERSRVSVRLDIAVVLFNSRHI